jgi:hypothetical protein
MSLKTWIEKYMPVPAEQATGSELEAAKHSLRKWKGFEANVLQEHGISQDGPEMYDDEDTMFVGCSNCALCRRHAKVPEGGNPLLDERIDCEDCILYEVRGRPCYGHHSPWRAFIDHDPEPMIKLLQLAVDRLEAKEKT